MITAKGLEWTQGGLHEWLCTHARLNVLVSKVPHVCVSDSGKVVEGHPWSENVITDRNELILFRGTNLLEEDEEKKRKG